MSYETDYVERLNATITRLTAELTTLRARLETVEAALTCAVNVWAPLEPPDSRAVSDEFVAVASVPTGNDNPQCYEIIKAANARASQEGSEPS